MFAGLPATSAKMRLISKRLSKLSAAIPNSWMNSVSAFSLRGSGDSCTRRRKSNSRSVSFRATASFAANMTTLILWHRPDGGRVAFTGSGSTWTAVPGHIEKLEVGTGGDAGRYIVTLRDQTTLVFEGSGAYRLLRTEDRFGKSLAITWGSPTTTLTDAAGRTTTVTFTGSLITSVVDPAGRTWSFIYDTSHLTRITDPAPGGGAATPVTRIWYDVATHRPTRLGLDRDGVQPNVDWLIGYTSGRVTSIVDPIANVDHADVANTFSYGTGSTDVNLLQTYSPAVRATTGTRSTSTGG